MKTPLLFAALAAGITLAASAEARDGARDGARGLSLPSFEELDANADGGVTLTEIETFMADRAEARFADADTDGDGALSAQEMLARADSDRAERMANRIARQIEKADANGDGVLQIEEIRDAGGERGARRGANPERMFDRVDADENGTLSAEEFAAALERMQDRRPRGDN
ncbi:EF-hand domain-containing protein [Pseudooctadecabacter sp.]|uniref:EF-hand domain-containing protein n=1 Tax=Pseudooctadecabacter sp. TaxID=1966338 RepID=UPI0025F051B6|nr:EF-hand domain-containing protein [Pseudooctadecabacter sp.]